MKTVHLKSRCYYCCCNQFELCGGDFPPQVIG